MLVWRHIPLLKFLIPFILGIYVATNNWCSISVATCFTSIAFLVLWAIHFYVKKTASQSLISWGSFVSLVLLFFLGICLTEFKTGRNYKTHFSNFLSADAFLVEVVDPPSIKQKGTFICVAVCQALDSIKCHQVQGKANLFLSSDSIGHTLAYGDQLIIRNRFLEISSPSNPSQFDLKYYYSIQGIYHNAFLTVDQWYKVSSNQGNHLLRYGHLCQDYLKRVFHSYFKDKSSRGIAQAIMFGFREEINPEWLHHFSQTGTIHVLAVSGLHVGVLYFFLAMLFGMRRSSGKLLIVKSMVIVGVLFFYTMLTGFSASVLRATIMISVIILGNAINRQTNVYNSLCVACFILLLVDPMNLFMVGFQFSFLAVLGIVYWQKDIRNWFPSYSYLSDKILTLLSVSLAAQLATFPLGIYYFHQFPTFFLLSNLLVLPCVVLIFYLGLSFVCCVHIVPFTGKIITGIMNLYIQFIGYVVRWIYNLPYAVFDHIYITFIQMILLYLVIVCAEITIKYKLKTGFLFCICGIFALLYFDWKYTTEYVMNTEVVIMDVKKGKLIGFKANGHIAFIVSDGLMNDDNLWKYTLRPYLVANHLIDNYTLLPMCVTSQKAIYPNLRLLGKGLVWFDNKSYRVFNLSKDIPIELDGLDCEL